MDIKGLISKKLIIDEKAYNMVERNSDKISDYVFSIDSEICDLERKLKQLKELYNLYKAFDELGIKTRKQLGDKIYEYVEKLYMNDPKNKDIEWLLQDSVNEGSIIGKLAYAKALIYGDFGIKTSPQEGLDMLYELSLEDNAEACYEFVIINEKLPKVIDGEYAYKMCEKAAKLGYTKAIERLQKPFDLRTYTQKLKDELNEGKISNYYLLSLRDDLSIDERTKYLALAIENNDYRALFDMGLMHKNNNNIDEAINFFTKSGTYGYSEAYIELGKLMIPNGEEHFYDYSKIDVTLLPLSCHKKEFEYYVLAADLDNLEGLLYAGIGYYQGYVTNRDYEKAFNCFARATELGDKYNAPYYLGQCYEKGLGCKQDEYAALMYYAMSADKGNINSMVSLYNIYINGLGTIEPDIEIANKYLFMSGIGRQ